MLDLEARAYNPGIQEAEGGHRKSEVSLGSTGSPFHTYFKKKSRVEREGQTPKPKVIEHVTPTTTLWIDWSVHLTARTTRSQKGMVALRNAYPKQPSKWLAGLIEGHLDKESNGGNRSRE